MKTILEIMAEEKGIGHSMSGLFVGIGWLVIWTVLLLSHALVIIV